MEMGRPAVATRINVATMGNINPKTTPQIADLMVSDRKFILCWFMIFSNA